MSKMKLMLLSGACVLAAGAANAADTKVYGGGSSLISVYMVQAFNCYGNPQQLLWAQQGAFNQGMVGQVIPVLLDRPGPRIIGAHLDSWDFGTGAEDNGTGSASVLEVARAIAALGKAPKRSIRFALWGGQQTDPEIQCRPIVRSEA